MLCKCISSKVSVWSLTSICGVNGFIFHPELWTPWPRGLFFIQNFECPDTHFCWCSWLVNIEYDGISFFILSPPSSLPRCRWQNAEGKSNCINDKHLSLTNSGVTHSHKHALLFLLLLLTCINRHHVHNLGRHQS